ncbi:unnamed protein product, partial [Ectocarpus sp. 12 AP-2014]
AQLHSRGRLAVRNSYRGRPSLHRPRHQHGKPLPSHRGRYLARLGVRPRRPVSLFRLRVKGVEGRLARPPDFNQSHHPGHLAEPAAAQR